jgi:hypothetical protein
MREISILGIEEIDKLVENRVYGWEIGILDGNIKRKGY